MTTEHQRTTGPIVGHYKGRDIRAWVDTRGWRHEYVGIAAEDRSGSVALDQLSADEIVVAPGLIYRRMS